MGKKKKTKKEKKMPIWLTLILILLISAAFVLFCVGTGYFIDAIVAFITKTVEEEQKLQYTLTVAIMGTLHLFFFISLILGRMPFVKKKEGESYREDILGMFMIVLVLSAVMLIALSNMHDRIIDMIVAAIMFPTAGFIASPWIIKHVLKSRNTWTEIFYSHERGNLCNCKNDKDFYIVENPVSFEKRLYFSVIQQQYAGVIAVIAVMILITAITIFWISYGYDHQTESLLYALIEVRLKRATGGMFFFTVFIVAFSPAILSYCITGTICRIRIVKKHQYIACHAIVRKVDCGRISLSSDKYYYRYNYTTCFGIRERNIHDTPATLIFLPDNVFLFPDSKYMM